MNQDVIQRTAIRKASRRRSSSIKSTHRPERFSFSRAKLGPPPEIRQHTHALNKGDRTIRVHHKAEHVGSDVPRSPGPLLRSGGISVAVGVDGIRGNGGLLARKSDGEGGDLVPEVGCHNVKVGWGKREKETSVGSQLWREDLGGSRLEPIVPRHA